MAYDKTLGDLETEHQEWEREYFNHSPGIIDRWEGWIDQKLSQGASVEDIRRHLDIDNETKLIHGADEFIQHMLDHMLASLYRRKTVTQKRVERLERSVERGGTITPQQAMALTQYRREIDTIDRLSEDFTLVIMYRDSKGRLRTEPTQQTTLAKFYRDKKGRFVKPPTKESANE